MASVEATLGGKHSSPTQLSPEAQDFITFLQSIEVTHHQITSTTTLSEAEIQRLERLLSQDHDEVDLNWIEKQRKFITETTEKIFQQIILKLVQTASVSSFLAILLTYKNWELAAASSAMMGFWSIAVLYTFAYEPQLEEIERNRLLQLITAFNPMRNTSYSVPEFEIEEDGKPTLALWKDLQLTESASLHQPAPATTFADSE